MKMKNLLMNILDMAENSPHGKIIPEYEIVDSVVILMPTGIGRLFACDCAEHVIHLWDTRMSRYTTIASLARDAIEASRDYFRDAICSEHMDSIRKSIDNYTDAHRTGTSDWWAVLAARNAAGLARGDFASAAFCAYMAAESGIEEREWQVATLRGYVMKMQD